MKTSNITYLNDFIPTLVLRNTVLFPGVLIPILVTKSISLNALSYSMENDPEKRFIALTLKEGADIESVTRKDFYTIGTLCKIEKIEQNEKGENVAYVKSFDRFEVNELYLSDEFNLWRSKGNLLPDVIDLDEPTEKALLSSLKEVSTEILNSINASDIFKKSIYQYENVGAFTNMVAQHLPLIISKKQEILEIFSLKNRSLKVLELLVEQREMIKVNNEVGLKISEKTSKAYRESILREQLKAIKDELGEGERQENGEKKSLRDRIIEAHLPKEVEKVALDQANRLDSMGQQNAESHVIKNYIDLILNLPWNEESISDLDIERAQKILDFEHFGLEKIKKHIIQHLAVMKLSPDKKGSILLFVGPPGVGKTSLGESIAKALGRKFVRVSLGGVRDDAEIRGHRRTYIGAMPGRIIEGIKRGKEKNPLFMLDEIDKLGKGYGGDPASALLEVLDPEQNATFTDQYLDLPFDLSKVFFVATANSLDTIPGPLLDRMEVIQLSGYTTEEKVHIAINHLIPKQKKEHGLDQKKIEFKQGTIKFIIEEYTREAGVRNLQRKIANVFRYLALDFAKNIEFQSVEVTVEVIEEALGSEKFSHDLIQTKTSPGVVTGLAWTPVGGDILFIESLMMPGTGKIQLTGKLGEVMSESAHIGLSLVRSRLSSLTSDFVHPMNSRFDFSKTDFHIHVPSGSIPKDGPSAGITIFTALCSLVLGKEVDPTLAMTGEITLRGIVLPVGGIKEKLIAAHRSGVKKVILSQKNKKDLLDVPESVKKDINLIFIENINELLYHVFGKVSGVIPPDLLSPSNLIENLS